MSLRKLVWICLLILFVVCLVRMTHFVNSVRNVGLSYFDRMMELLEGFIKRLQQWNLQFAMKPESVLIAFGFFCGKKVYCCTSTVVRNGY